MAIPEIQAFKLGLFDRSLINKLDTTLMRIANGLVHQYLNHLQQNQSYKWPANYMDILALDIPEVKQLPSLSLSIFDTAPYNAQITSALEVYIVLKLQMEWMNKIIAHAKNAEDLISTLTARREEVINLERQAINPQTKALLQAEKKSAEKALKDIQSIQNLSINFKAQLPNIEENYRNSHATLSLIISSSRPLTTELPTVSPDIHVGIFSASFTTT